MDQQKKTRAISDALRGLCHIAIDVRIAMLVTDVILRLKVDRFDARLIGHGAS
jgi:hypothetical protein